MSLSKSKSGYNNAADLAVKGLKKKIIHAEEQCKKQAERGRTSGTYWHGELARLESLLKQVEKSKPRAKKPTTKTEVDNGVF